MGSRWDRALYDYYRDNIHPKIYRYSAWSAAELGLSVNGNTIFDSNQCESLNFVNQMVQEWKEYPPDKAFFISRDSQRAKLVDIFILVLCKFYTWDQALYFRLSLR